MSGGYFNYKYALLLSLADEIQGLIEAEGMQDGRDLLAGFDEAGKDVVMREMKDLTAKLRQCASRAYSLEWLLSGDFGAETYLAVLKGAKP